MVLLKRCSFVRVVVFFGPFLQTSFIVLILFISALKIGSNVHISGTTMLAPRLGLGGHHAHAVHTTRGSTRDFRPLSNNERSELGVTRR